MSETPPLPAGYALRSPAADEAPLLQAIDIEAGRLFADSAHPSAAEGPPTVLSAYRAHVRLGEALVAVDASDRPVGFAVTGVLDDALHLYELSVLPAHGRRGLGRILVEAVCDRARRRDLDAVTLATFRDVPWNRPFYARLGFREIGKADWTPALFKIHQREAALGLPMAARCLMRRPLDASS